MQPKISIHIFPKAKVEASTVESIALPPSLQKNSGGVLVGFALHFSTLQKPRASHRGAERAVDTTYSSQKKSLLVPRERLELS